MDLKVRGLEFNPGECKTIIKKETGGLGLGIGLGIGGG